MYSFLARSFSVISVSSVAKCYGISVFFDHRIAHEQPLFRPFHPQYTQGTKSDTLGVSEAKVAFDRTVPLDIESRPRRPEDALAGLDAFLAADTHPLINDAGIRPPLAIHLEGSYRASFEAWRVRTLVADLRLVVSQEVFLFQDNPGEGSRVSTFAVEIRAHHLADPASRTEGFIYHDHSLRQGHLLPVGEGNDFQQVPQAHDASQGEGAQGEAFENSPPVNFFGHLRI